MDNDSLRKHLEELHRELDGVESVDDSTQELLSTLVSDIRLLLAGHSPTQSTEDELSVGDRLALAIEQLGESHPVLVAMMRDASEMLSNLGI